MVTSLVNQPAGSLALIPVRKASSKPTIENIPTAVGQIIGSFLSPCEGATAGARLAATSKQMRASLWVQRALDRRVRIFDTLNQEAFWDSKKAKETIFHAVSLGATVAVAHYIIEGGETTSTVLQGSQEAYDFPNRIKGQAFSAIVSKPLHQITFSKIIQKTIDCLVPGLQGCQTHLDNITTPEFGHTNNNTFFLAWLFDCATNPRAILPPPPGNMLNRVCVLKSYQEEFVVTTIRCSINIPDVESYLSQLINTATNAQKLATIAMALAEATVDSVATLVEMGTGYKAPTLLRGAGKVGAVVAVAALTGTSVTPYAIGRAGIFALTKVGSVGFSAITKAASFVKRRILEVVLLAS